MLKLPEERRRWGESKGAGRGRGERRENPLPSPFPLSFFRPRTYRKGYYFYSPQSSTVIKSKMAATTILRTRTRFRPPKIRLHCGLVHIISESFCTATKIILDRASVHTQDCCFGGAISVTGEAASRRSLQWRVTLIG